MSKPKTYALYVNLSASQTRKRLKGHGFGVKRVEAADRNQAVITHTATREHLRDLEALFADVLTSSSIEGLDIPVENLRNLGPTSAEWLRDVGIQTRADLKRVGPIAAFKLVDRKQPAATLNLLWAIVGALTDRDWRALSEKEKEDLQQEVQHD